MPTDLFAANGADPKRQIWTVSRLNQDVKHWLDRSFGPLWLQGEISNFNRPRSGHCYFSMQDSLARIQCAMFRSRNRYLDFSPENGMQVLARGRLGLYEPRGEYQFIVERIEETGAGALQRQFAQRFERFQRAGLFDAKRKQPLPAYPRGIGIITSTTGAALRDVLDVLRRRYPVAEVSIYPTTVQGAGAARQIASQIARAAREQRCDTLLLVRGGGAMEDLWEFNEEGVVRAIVDCAIPIVCGVGHEIDCTLADFAADARAPTPSVAAELACPDRNEVSTTFRHWQETLRNTLRQRIERRQDHLQSLQSRLSLQHPQRQWQQQSQRLDARSQRLYRAVEQRRGEARTTLAQLEAKLLMQSPRRQIARRQHTIDRGLSALHSTMKQRMALWGAALKGHMHALHIASPMATLGRGYSITCRERRAAPLKHIAGLTPGEKICTRLSDGTIDSTVERIHKL